MFVTDLIASRMNAPVRHVVAALGTSTEEKGSMFVQKIWESSSAPRPRIYCQYQAVYNDHDVDIVYIGTPHAMHKQNCLDAIKSGKSVLCEKPFTINTDEAQEVIDTARAKGVFIMEGKVKSSAFFIYQTLLSLIFLPSFDSRMDAIFPHHTVSTPAPTRGKVNRQDTPFVC